MRVNIIEEFGRQEEKPITFKDIEIGGAFSFFDEDIVFIKVSHIKGDYYGH